MALGEMHCEEYLEEYSAMVVMSVKSDKSRDRGGLVVVESKIMQVTR